jgi:acetate kinase
MNDMNVLVLNATDAALRFRMVCTGPDRLAANADIPCADGSVERIGGEAVLRITAAEQPPRVLTAEIRDVGEAVEWLVRTLIATEGSCVDGWRDIDAVGHRVVHGGERFETSALITDEVLSEIVGLVPLAPLHNPANIRAIEAARKVFGPGTPQVAVFDTAFHHTIPEYAFLFPLPYSVYRRHRIRRYGFHGTAHRYVAYRWRLATGRSWQETDAISLHLGSGSSICALKDGVSVDVSMGLTPYETLLSGAVAGEIPAAALAHLMEKEKLGAEDVARMLAAQAGLLGVSGFSGNVAELLEEVEESDDRRAWLALEMYADRVRKYIGAHAVAVGGPRALLFTGEIGAGSPEVRHLILRELEWLGIEVDEAANREQAPPDGLRISAPSSRVEVWVIPSNEEVIIARDTVRVVHGIPFPS